MNDIFLLRDSGEIYGTYMTLEHAYNSLLQLIYTRYKYHKRDSISSCNIDHMGQAFQIIEYYNNVVKNVFNMDGDYYLYDSKKKMYPMDTISICDYITKINNFKTDEEYTCNNMDIFLPVDETEKLDISISLPTNTKPSTFISTIDDAEKNKQELDLLEAELLNLDSQKLIKIKINEADKIKMDEEIENEIQKKVIINSEIHDLKRDNILHEEKRIKFNADYEVFLKLEREMKIKKRKQDNVPEIFQRSYDTFKLMRENNIIGKSHEEMFIYFLENIKKIDFYDGTHNVIFDAPTLDELKAFCPSDDEYDINGNSSEFDEEYLSSESDSDIDTDKMINNVLYSKKETINNYSDNSSTTSSYDPNSDTSEELSASSMHGFENTEKLKVLHQLMTSMIKSSDELNN